MKNEDVKNLKKLSHEFKIPVSNLILILETLYEYDKNLSTDKKKEIIQFINKQTTAPQYNMVVTIPT